MVEASGIVLFFRDPDGRISAAIVDAATPGIERELLHPAGLTGWSWGTLRLHQVGIDPDRDLLGAPGAKARHDLTGLLYADGIHDSLYRSGGTSLLPGHPATAASPRPRTPVRAHLDRAA